MKNFLILGKTGVGKSSFINSVFNKPVAQTSSYEACTKVVEMFAYHAEFGQVCLLDTPGLAEDDLALDYHYLDLIKQAIKSRRIDFMIYVTPLNDTRFRPTEKRTIKLILETLGPQIWNSCWLIFTFAASIERKEFDTVSAHKTQIFNEYLSEIMNGGFTGFNRLYFLDNVVSNWHDDTVPVNEIFNQ